MQYKIYTDGACSGNPGPGACAAFIINESNPNLQYLVTEAYRLTTNNRMELMAVLMCFKHFRPGSSIKFITDSKYVADAVNKGWLNKWEDRDFHKRPNADLWRLLVDWLKMHKCTFEWIKGHDGNKGNEYVDKYAQGKIGQEPILIDEHYENTN